MRSVLLLLLAAAGVLLWLRLRDGGAGEPASTPAMTPAEEFKRIGEELYAGQCPQYGRGPRESMEAQLADASLPNGKRLQVQLDLADEVLEAGDVKRAIALLEENLALAEKVGNERQHEKAQRALGRAWLREGENQNCIARHNADCCIFPPRAGALHTVRQPAEEARKQYQAVLAVDPKDLTARWLVNLTTLLLGESIDDLPAEQRIPRAAFGEVPSEPLFRDVAVGAGLAVNSLAGGVAAEDFDGDGLLDVLTSTSDPLGSLRYFRSRGDGTFEDRSDCSHASEQLGGLNLIAGDYDEDGDQDAVVLRGGWLVRSE